MIEVVRPRTFVPIHGTRHHLVRHAELATSLGVAETLLLENGDVGVFTAMTLGRGERWPTGRVYQAFGKVVAGEVVKERSTLAAEGVVFAVVPVSEGNLAGQVQLAARGVLAGPELRAALAMAALEAERAASGERKRGLDGQEVKEAVRIAVRRVVGHAVGYKPEVLVTLVPVARTAGAS